LLDLLEAREEANNELKAQDAVIEVASLHMTDLVGVRNELWATWRLINNQLAQAAVEVFPMAGVQVQVNAPLPSADEIRQLMIDAEREDMDRHYDEYDEPIEGNEVPEPGEYDG